MQTQTSNALHNAIMEAGGKDRPPMLAPVAEGSFETTIVEYMENYKNVSQDILDQMNAEAEAVQIIFIGIDNDIYSTVDACPNACEMWKAIERLKQGESITVQDLETNLYWEFGKFTSRDGESLKSYYSRFYKMMNKLVRNQCDVTNHQVNIQFLLQLQSEWQRSQQTIRNRGKLIFNSSALIYDQEPATVTEDDEMSKENEIDKLMALISLLFKKIYKPTNNNLHTSSNTSRANQDNSPRINRGTGYENQRVINVVGARENVEEARVKLNAEQADWKDDTDDESDDQELEAHYMYMAQIQEVTPDNIDNSGPIFDTEPLQKDDIDELAQERDLLSSLIEKLKCEINDSKNRNKFLETSNKNLVDKLKGEIEDFKTKNKSLESSNNHFKEANNKLLKTKQLMFKDLKKFQAKLDSKEMMKNEKSFKENQSNVFRKEREQYFKIQDLKDQLQDKGVIPTTSVSRPQLKSNQLEDKVMLTNSQRKKQQVADHRRNFKFSNNKTFVTACNDSLNAKNSTVNFVCVTCGKWMVKFGNDQIAPIIGYEDLVQGTITIKRVYYVEGLNHNLFSVDQLCDADLEVAFRKSTCYIRDLKGNDLLTGSRGTDLYSITLQDTSSSNSICLMAKVTSSQAWLWHRRLTHLNIDTINLLSKYNIVTGLPKLKFVKDYLCSSCELGKSKRKSFHTKTTPSSKRPLQRLHMDLCGLMWVESINRKKYVLVIIDNYSRYTWTYFLRSKDETPAVLIDFLTLVQRGLHAQIRTVQTDKGYSTLSRAYRVFNKRTRITVKTIHVNFDELLHMALDHVSSDLVPQCPTTAVEHNSLSPGPQSQENVPHAAETVTTSNELDLLFSLMFDELLNGTTVVMLKSSAVNVADAPNQRQQKHTTPYTSTTVVEDTPPLNIEPTQAPTVTGTENINQAETITKKVQVKDDEFINIFYTPKKDHPLEQVIGNPSQLIRTRCQLKTYGEMCMFALTVIRTKLKNIKEAMAASAWIESMQEELH
uniref:Retrovirus-related Pol polyprotein from transposon TNT 1-94 n=1 Tax=Tanacetum cinerariifolium TaxID=118510 RepID=A0A6L2KXD3_TANCI|nr:retrovirus-related Pol polyprotein from transposon TNT 1-94 [Tanacetum cinerariifolium]